MSSFRIERAIELVQEIETINAQSPLMEADQDEIEQHLSELEVLLEDMKAGQL